MLALCTGLHRLIHSLSTGPGIVASWIEIDRIRKDPAGFKSLAKALLGNPSFEKTGLKASGRGYVTGRQIGWFIGICKQLGEVERHM